jgi:outer membrane lipoprotein carrier protein
LKEEIVKILLFVLLLFQTSLAGTLTDYFKGINTLHIVFSQRMELPVAGDEVTMYKGEIFYKKPLKFLWKYTWGSKSLVVSNGRLMEAVLDDGTCQISSVKENLSLFPILELVEAPEHLKEEYNIIYRKLNSDEIFILKPKSKNSYFKGIRFLFERNRLKEVVAIQYDGTEQTYLIKEFEKNVPLRNSLFKLEECERPAQNRP